AGLVGGLVFPTLVGASVRSLPIVIVAGLLVGFGTRMGSGCTSGHGVCGLSRLSVRSLVAVATFMTTGAVTASLAGGPL
ncbi:MAG: YeeE/YedE thiosulfate transporter family protein, partial [Kofleriaceae bacterium]